MAADLSDWFRTVTEVRGLPESKVSDRALVGAIVIFSDDDPWTKNDTG